MNFFKIARWIVFILVYLVYGLTILELIYLQSLWEKPPAFVLENIWNAAIIIIFTILVLVFSITLTRLKIKSLFRFHFLGDDNFYYDICKNINRKRKISFNLFISIIMILVALLFGLLTYWNYSQDNPSQRKPIMHFWLLYTIIIYCIITLKGSCKTKIKNMDDISKSKFT